MQPHQNLIFVSPPTTKVWTMNTTPSATGFPTIVGSPASSPHGSAVDAGPLLSGSMNWEPVRKRLLGPDLNDVLRAANELREGIEIVHTVEFPLMLSALLPAFSTILAHRTAPSSDVSTTEHKLRNVILEIISRMPSNEILRPHAPHLVAVALDILNRDYEENALVASRIIFDLYKVYRSLPQDYVQPYLDFVQNSYRSLPTAVQRNFLFPALATGSPMDATSKRTPPFDIAPTDSKDSATAEAAAATTSVNASNIQSPSANVGGSSVGKIPASPVAKLSPRSNSSFRVLTECPLIVMLMFQLYPKFLRSNIPSLINVMMEALALRAPPIQSITQDSQGLDVNSKRLYFSRCRELVAAQAKTLSFLTYLLRGFSNELKPHVDRLATNVVALMSTCPREFISTRKELLVATRHLLNSEFRNGFFRHVDSLLDERVLIGSHHRFSEQTILRPLGYTTLSDLVHHVRTRLTMPQMSKVVSMFSRVLHDSSMALPMSTQYTAVRTLLSVVDIVLQNKDPDPQVGRDILVRILKALVEKLSSLQSYREMIESLKKSDTSSESLASENPLAQKTDPFQLDLVSTVEPKESLRDLKSMVRAIIVGHKTIIWYINNYRSQREKEKNDTVYPQTGANEEVMSAMLKITHTELALIDKYIMLSFPCMKWLKDDETQKYQQTPRTHASDRSSTSDQYRDALTYFAAAFSTLDGHDLRRTLGRRLDLLVDAIMDEPTAILVPRQLLGTNATTSFEFCTILLDFLVENMDGLAVDITPGIFFIPPATTGDADDLERLKNGVAAAESAENEPGGEGLASRKKRSNAYLLLFERVLKSLSSYPDNEKALRPHLRKIVATCLRSSMEKSKFEVDNYCMLLRYIFRSISAGKFEESYRELLPLLPTVLNGLFRVIGSTDDRVLHHTIIELLLTIPARLSSLLPHMNLLLRIIVCALESHSGDLVNLGLRTLEFWVDNLNPEFLFPELSKQKKLFVQLMKALSTHLKPAPYPYGLLTLRLLGKLGGKNRRVLREPMDIRSHPNAKTSRHSIQLICTWLDTGGRRASHEMMSESSQPRPPTNECSFSLPLDECVSILQRFADPKQSKPTVVEPSTVGEEEKSVKLSWVDCEKLWEIDFESVDLHPYCMDVVNGTKKGQVEAATSILRSALARIVEIGPSSLEFVDINWKNYPGPGEAKAAVNDEEQTPDTQSMSAKLMACNEDLEKVCLGLMFAGAGGGDGSDELTFLRGLLTNVFILVRTHQHQFARVDANGSTLSPKAPSEIPLGSSQSPAHGDAVDDFFEDGLGSLKPFGYFEQTGVLRRRANPLVINRSLAHFLSHPPVVDTGLGLLDFVLELPKKLGQTDAENATGQFERGSLIYFESLLSHLIETCVSCDWHAREGLYRGIVVMINSLGGGWNKNYEIELMHAALFSLKSAPREMPFAAVKAYEFLVRVCAALYGFPKFNEKESKSTVFLDILTSTRLKDDPASSDDRKPILCPSNDVIQVLISEMASTKQIVRVAARFVLKCYVLDVRSSHDCHVLFQRHMPLVKRVLFSRSLRLLPLPEQVGAVEALALIVDRLPKLIPLNDQHLLAFLSELLKMSSVADGEMADSSLGGYVVDKNGFASLADGNSQSTKQPNEKECEIYSSFLFLRRDCVLQIHGTKILIPGELATGVQLRVSSISLLRSVIRGHPNPFFDAENSTPIGNIRPHVISLLFRSLVSSPLKSVMAAHDALRDVLSLSVVTSEGSDGVKSKSRLRKELLQTCIRPVLLNLRDYSRLSVQLVRGLSRLLSLLSSWFNKTLGEKLLDHLQKWTDPNRIRSQKIWPEGKEPDVAAAIIELFVLLPHASHFVEPLVKTTIKLEACLAAFKFRHVRSPYRQPLANYLNKHCQHTVAFFFQRLKTPLYSELFQDLIKLPSSQSLREYLSGRQCSVSLLNVCLERPLAIIRSEKTSSGSAAPGMSPQPSSSPMNTSDLFVLHGIKSPSRQRSKKELSLRQELEAKKKKMQILHQELARAKGALQAKTGSGAQSPETKAAIDDAKKKHKLAKSSYERGAKELNDVKQRYAAEVAQSNASSTKISPGSSTGTSRPMNIESLELQHQGFHLVETLMKNDDNYLKDHNDVLRACRWLWRSKGRYLRLQHEESVPPRYHEESKLLASFLVNYSRNFPSDVDLLFELIRIFLQTSTNDFSFVRTFLSDAVRNRLSAEQKKQIVHRFFALLAGESTEEIKTLSIQLVVYPMLHSSFHQARIQKPVGHAEPAPNGSDERAGTSFDFVDSTTIKKFIHEVLFNGDKHITCGDRLKIELLRLSNLFLEFVPFHISDLGKDLIKFCWTLLKSDDNACKSWAYIVVSRFISVLETPPKIVLQVYVALLRSHQQDSKDLVRAAIDLVVPALPTRLGVDEFRKVIDYTNRIMFEEGNSIPQLAHIWHTIVKHPQVFYDHRHQFVRYMISSLNRLGLPPNCPPESRSLATSIIELVLQWDGGSDKVWTSTDRTQAGKRPASDVMRQPEGRAEKKRRVQSGYEVSGTGNISTLLDMSMVETVANFLVRLKVLVADPKVDVGSTDVESRLLLLLRKVVTKWKNVLLRPVYLEKIVAMCKEDNIAASADPPPEKAKKSSGKTASKSSTTGKAEEGKHVPLPLLCACLDILVAVAEEAPENEFLTNNTDQLREILICGFRLSRKRDEGKVIREKVQKFVVSFLSSRPVQDNSDLPLPRLISVMIEEFLVDAEIECRKVANGPPTPPEVARQTSTRGKQPPAEEELADECPAMFVVQMIREIGKVRNSCFNSFSNTLLTLLVTLVKKHTAATSSKQKQGSGSVTSQAGSSSVRQMYYTPSIGILAESTSMESTMAASSGTPRSSQAADPFQLKELKDFDSTLRCTVMVLEMLGNSDIPYSFTQNRKTLFQTISSILDMSNNVQLLLTAVRAVGKWMLSDGSSGPLTVKERNSFLWKIASFDFNGLPDIVSQPLVDLVAQYIIASLTGRRPRGTYPGGSGVQVKDDETLVPRRVSGSDDMIMGRCLVSCLLTANNTLREKLTVLFLAQTNPEGQLSAEETLPRREPIEVLWQLLHSDFEGLGGRYWITVFVDMLLASLRSVVRGCDFGLDERAADTAKRSVPPLRQAVVANSGTVFDDGMKLEYREFCRLMLEEQEDFARGGRAVLSALRQLSHGNTIVCQTLFKTLLCASWRAIQTNNLRTRLVPAIESLLSRAFHSQFLKGPKHPADSHTTNAVRSFLGGIAELEPLPAVDVDLLVSLAETYNSWYEALSILEGQYYFLRSQNLSKKGCTLRDKTLLATRHCYRVLGESNVWMGLALHSCSLPATKLAASFDVHGRVDEALEAYSGLVELVESGGASPTDLEAEFWEERWVDLHREQCQLGVVAEYANMSENTSLMLECAWKQQQWDRVRSLFSSSTLVAAVESGDPAVKMSETLLAVADGKLSDVENLHAQTAQLCLYKWQLLPQLTTASLSHASLLHFFHRLVEIRESGQIMVETSTHSNGKTLPDLKNLLSAWRHRLPNDYENLARWDEVFTWRAHMFNAITSNFHWSEPSTLASLHDRPWTAIRMSMTARKQGMRQTALLLLNKLTDSRAMDVSDAYLKLREQILAYDNPDNDLERTGGLNLINTTNLSFFDAPQKSELFRLKAIFLASLRRTSKSNQAYCHSVQIFPRHMKAWVSWGGLCSSLGVLTEKQAEGTKEGRAASSKKVAQYLAQAMGCYLEAIQIDGDEKSRIHLPKCLWILTKDGTSPGVLCQTMENRGTQLPPWVWLPWIPQLLTGLCRVEGRAIKAILNRLVKAYPQAVYYSLRAFYLERRDVERAKGISASSGQHMPSVAYAEEMMSTLRRSHASLWSSLEAILEELIVKFRPSYEEELLATISALLERAESHAEKQYQPDKARLEDEDAMVSSWSKTLGRIAAKFFRASDTASTTNRRDERVKKTAEFKRKYKSDFERDFKVNASDSQSETKPKFRLDEYITRLQKWKRKLEAQVACTPTSLPLIESSHSLAMFAGELPDLWPGACDTRYLIMNTDRYKEEDEASRRGQSSTSSSAVIARKAALNAAIAASSAASTQGVGGDYGGGSAAIEVPGQYCPNSSALADIKPCPELHAKVVRFEPFVEVLRRNDQLVRRAGMIGSDGRTYRFLLQFAIPYWTRTDERAAQTHYVVDKFLRQNHISARNHLSLQPSAAIPVAQRLRMTLDNSSRVALDEVFRSGCDSKQLQEEATPTFFLEELQKRLEGKVGPDTQPDERLTIEKSARLAVFQEICNSQVDSKLFLRYLNSTLDGPEALFQFRRSFAAQLAANSLLQYVFSVAERNPQRFVLLQNNAHMLSPDFRVSYSNQGFIEGQQVPFRLTRNVEEVIGESYFAGRFVPAMAMVAAAVRERRDEFDPIMRLLMRDDILAWYSKSLAKTDSKTQELERQLIERVSKNVATIQSRFAECAPSRRTSETALNARVEELCDEARKPDNLCMMSTSYHAWL